MELVIANDSPSNASRAFTAEWDFAPAMCMQRASERVVAV